MENQKTIKYGQNSGSVSLEFVKEQERAWIQERRKYASISEDKDLIALALSGGGVRAAFTALGFINQLSVGEILKKFDYLSSVSGGGYTACAFLYHVGVKAKELPLSNDLYQLRHPGYRYTDLFNMLWSVFTLFLPLLAYFSLFFIGIDPVVINLNGISFSNPLVNIGTVVSLFFLVVCYIYRLMSKRDDAADLFGVILVISWGELIGSMPVWLGFGPVLGGIVLFTLIYERWLSANPHRTVADPLPGSIWIWSAWLAVATAFSAKVLTLVLAKSIWLIFPLFLFISIGVYAWIDLDRSNQWNRLFHLYRRKLRERFLPLVRNGYETLLNEVTPYWNPYPIINAAMNRGTNLEPFELAPLFSGGSTVKYFRTNKWLPKLKVSDAMAISGCAVDTLSSKTGVRRFLGTMFGGMGYWIPTEPNRINEKVAIFFSHLAMVTGRKVSNVYRLSDGGFVDNLGVIPLLQRRVKTIVCLDCGYDPNYEFDDLRRLCLYASDKGLGKIVLDEISSASVRFRFCQIQSGLLVGKVIYPGCDGESDFEGVYIHIKMYNPVSIAKGKFPGFPHFTTADQLLKEEEISALYDVGIQLGKELECFIDKGYGIN